MVNLTGVNKCFFPGTPNEILALKNINFHVRSGDFISVIGSNGAGKSTLLKVISGREKADGGRIELAGKNVTTFPEYKRAMSIGSIDQNPLASTASDMTIEENLAMAYVRGRRRGLSKAVTPFRIREFKNTLIETGLGLENRLKVPVGTLSGGQRQALALVMATITEPKVLLLDEHTAALDPTAARLIMDLTRRLVSSRKLTTIMITHNMEQAINFGNRLIMMHRGEFVLDLNGQEKSKLTVPGLLEKFSAVSGTHFAEDRVLLAGNNF